MSHWLFILVLAILCVTVLTETVRERQSALAALRAAEAEAERLRQENQRIREEIKTLSKDPKVIERIARDELNMLRRDEFVFSFPDENSQSRVDEIPAPLPRNKQVQ